MRPCVRSWRYCRLERIPRAHTSRSARTPAANRSACLTVLVDAPSVIPLSHLRRQL
ncbi:hypothetical protein FTUN_8220 [Frigoriglobus tundricola]|uniref:Uncharacterized protein n=1 Tax=Frigoriglobus tundricola TaxID=2774151 RepID=A0A6M5Z2F9_9BACT|nr:hypothetical protein FTUN_8220 [Frigoriglobus tundricola]